MKHLRVFGLTTALVTTLAATLGLLFGCTSNALSTDSASITNQTENQAKSQPTAFAGQYVSSGYAQRSKGADWVAVEIRPAQKTNNINAINIRVYARDDIKQPTCSLQTTANAVGANQYLANDNGSNILLTFTPNSLTLSAGKGSTRYDLMYYCSGGASIAGSYQRLMP